MQIISQTNDRRGDTSFVLEIKETERGSRAQALLPHNKATQPLAGS
jgi:hypothetical protein